MKAKSVNKITLYNILSTVLLQGISLFTAPYFSRVLGNSNYGVVSIYTTWATLLSTVFGLQTQSTIAVSKNEFQGKENIRYQSSVLFLSVLSYAAFSAVMVCCTPVFAKWFGMSNGMYFAVILQSFGMFCSQFLNMKFSYEFKADKNLILSVFISLTSVIIALVMIQILPSDINYWGKITGTLVVYALVSVVACIYIFSKGKTFYVKEFWMYCLPLSIPIIFHSLSGLVLNQSDRIMLQNMENNSTVGIYSLAFSFANVLSVIWNALNNSWVPYYYKYTRENDFESIKIHSRNYAELFTVLASGFILLTPEVFHIFADETYWSGTNLIPLFAIGFYFVFLYSFPVNYEFYNKNTKVIAIGTACAALMNIVLNYFFILKMSMTGAAIATAVSHSFQFIFHHICAKRLIKKGDYPYSVKFYCCCVISFCCVFSFCMIAGNSLTLLRWGFGGALGIFELYRIYKRRSIF